MKFINFGKYSNSREIPGKVAKTLITHFERVEKKNEKITSGIYSDTTFSKEVKPSKLLSLYRYDGLPLD